jgi:hypothetical protein
LSAGDFGDTRIRDFGDTRIRDFGDTRICGDFGDTRICVSGLDTADKSGRHAPSCRPLFKICRVLGGRHMECAYYFDFCRLRRLAPSSVIACEKTHLGGEDFPSYAHGCLTQLRFVLLESGRWHLKTDAQTRRRWRSSWNGVAHQYRPVVLWVWGWNVVTTVARNNSRSGVSDARFYSNGLRP